MMKPGDDGPAGDHPDAVLLLLPHLVMVMVMVMVMVKRFMMMVMMTKIMIMAKMMMLTKIWSHLLHPTGMPATVLLLLAAEAGNKHH